MLINRLTRWSATGQQLLAYTANLSSALIGIEACSRAHFIGAALREQGHDVRLIPAQFVKPFLKSNKNDFLDSEAIAAGIPTPYRGPWAEKEAGKKTFQPALPRRPPGVNDQVFWGSEHREFWR